MIAIAVDTPAQLIAALLAYQRIGRGKPIILFGRHGLETKGRHPSIQRMLFYGDENKTPSRLLSGLMSPLTLLRTIPGYDAAIDIDTIITSRSAFVSTYLNKEYAKRHVFLPVYLIESGPRDYYDAQPKDRFVNMCSMMKEPTHMNFISRAFFSAPELYPFDVPFPIEPLPHADLETNQVLGPMLGRPPKDERSALLSRPCIFFEAAEGKTDFDIEAMDMRTLSAASRAVGPQNILVLSTGARSMPYEAQVKSMQPSLPIESFYFRCDFNWKILLSADLGPLTAPKLFFDQEPFVVYTGALEEPSVRADTKKALSFFEDFSKRYTDSDRCAAPTSLLELKEVLRRFLARSGGA